jgi:hypothetical protein
VGLRVPVSYWTYTLTRSRVADALPPPKVSNEPTNNVEKINSTMLLGSYLAATTGGDDKTYLTEARVFYQDVQNVILFHLYEHA